MCKKNVELITSIKLENLYTDMLFDIATVKEHSSDTEKPYELSLIYGMAIGYKRLGLITEEQYINIGNMTMERLNSL